MVVKKISIILFIPILAIISCYFDPVYTDQNIKDNNSVEIALTNGNDIDVIEVQVTGKEMTDIHFFQPLSSSRFSFFVPSGKDRSFTLNGFVEDSLFYDKVFNADITSDTSFTIKIKIAEGPVPETPPNVMAELVDGDVLLSWDPAGFATGYIIYRKSIFSSSEDSIATTKENQFLDSKVILEHTYFYAVSAYNNAGESDLSEFVEIQTDEADKVPGIPEDLEVSDVTSSSVTLQWKRTAQAASYIVYRVTGGGTPNEPVDTVYDNTFEDTDVIPENTYIYAVSAKNSKGESQKSDKVSTTIPLSKPGTPKNVSAIAVSDRSIRITWDEVKYADEYEIYKSDEEDGTYKLEESSEISLSYISTGLTPESTWYYKVKAKNEIGTSPFSEVASATTMEEFFEKPEKPEDVAAEALSPYAVLVNWPGVENAYSYNVYRSSSSSGTYTKKGSTPDTVYTDSGLSENTQYYYKVSAENNVGESDQSDYVSVQTMILLKVPTGLSGEALSATEIDLSWNSVAGADGYRIFRSKSQNGTYDEIDSTDVTTYTDTGLDANTTYYYKISAKGPSGESQQTSSISVTTKMPVPNIPDGLKAEGILSSEILVTFNTVVGSDGYKIYSSETASGFYTLVSTVGSGTFTHTGLDPETEYFFRVSAYNDEGESEQSDSVSATTLPAPPDPPTGLKATALSKEEIEVEFNTVSDADGYIIFHNTSSSGTYERLDTITSTTYTHGQLQSGSTHYYKVAAYNSNGESDLTNYVSAETTSGKVAYIEACRSCNRCPSWCDLDAIKKGGFGYIIDTDLCDGCGDCIPSCPYDYIILVDAWTKVKDWVRRLITADK